MLFSYGYGWQQNRRLQKMQANRQRFQSPCHRGDTAWCTLPDGVHPWLHAKPLDAAIRQVPTPYCPGGHHGWRFWMKKNTNKTQLLPSFLTVDRHKKAIKHHPARGSLLTSSTQLALTLALTPLVKLKSSATFWAIKCSKGTKIQKVIKLEQSPRKPVAHICTSSGYPVN